MKRECDRGIEMRSGLLAQGGRTIARIVAPIAVPISIPRTASFGRYRWTGETGCHNKVATVHAEDR